MISGWVAIDKPKGLSSFSVGHTGTLDPLATGVMVVALGQACKLAAYVSQSDKTYAFRVMWGQERSTDDAEGEVTATSPHMPSEQDIASVLPDFIGEVSQVPPRYCAVKIDGKRAYALARKGKDFLVPERFVSVYALELRAAHSGYADFFVSCSSGTYVRALGRDIARKLGACGYIDVLRRESVGQIKYAHCGSLAGPLGVLDVDALWDPQRVLCVEASVLEDLSHGRKVFMEGVSEGTFLVRTKKKSLPASVAVWRDGVLSSKRFLHGGEDR